MRWYVILFNICYKIAPTRSSSDIKYDNMIIKTYLVNMYIRTPVSMGIIP